MKIRAIDISRTASASSIVFEMLRKAIIEGALTEGELEAIAQLRSRFFV